MTNKFLSLSYSLLKNPPLVAYLHRASSPSLFCCKLHTLQTSHSLNNRLMFARVVFQELESAVSSSSSSRLRLKFSSSRLKQGLSRCPMNDILMSEGQKLHPQVMLSPTIFEHTVHEGACNLNTPSQNTLYITFSLPLMTFPHASDFPAFVSSNYLKSLTLGKADLRLVLPSSCLVAS